MTCYRSLAFVYGTSIECAYCMPVILICSNVFLIFVVGSSSFVSKFFKYGMHVMALALATKAMSWATFHPIVVMLLMSGWYFVIILSRVFATNLSL
jgi:hypothetical protein